MLKGGLNEWVGEPMSWKERFAMLPECEATLMEKEGLPNSQSIPPCLAHHRKFHFWMVCQVPSLFVDESCSDQAQSARVIKTGSKLLEGGLEQPLAQVSPAMSPMKRRVQ